MKEISLYVHIPFCKQKCLYCDFPSYASLEMLMDDYVDALSKEIEEKGKGYLIKSIFIGGGTPSYLSESQIKRVLDSINKLNKAKDIEFSMECNPGALEEEKLKTMLLGGVNRISMGLQARQDSLLKTLGRIHTFDEFVENFNLARKIGFNNINVDLMFGLPNQKLEDWIETLETIVKLKPDHISAYSLIIEEGTCFYNMYNNNKLRLPSEEEEREMYAITKDILSVHGYHQYEISNYSKEGCECLHNKIYWECKPYLGLGASASSFVDGYRFKNLDNVKEYVRRIKLNEDVIDEKIKNSIEDNIEEFMFMGLRLIDGISKEEFKVRFGRDVNSIYKEIIAKNIKAGLLEEDNKKLRLTSKGIELSNIVMSDFILDSK